MKKILFRTKGDKGEFIDALVVEESSDFIRLDYGISTKWRKKDELEIYPYPNKTT